MRLLAWQEASYRDHASQHARAAQLRSLGGPVPWWPDTWLPLREGAQPGELARFERETEGFSNSYDLIRHVIELRDLGNYEAAARYLKNYRYVAIGASANGHYVDAQTLWQMAFTFVRGGETEIAFDLMDRAARIAATLSFQGAGGADGGTLQLLERDRWRYLLFIDIAWAAATGTPPEAMTVVSRY